MSRFEHSWNHGSQGDNWGHDSGSGSSTSDSTSIIQVNQSNETVTATSSGSDNFVLHSLSQQGDVIDGFAVGQDHLTIHDPAVAPGDLASDLSLQPDADGASTDVVATVNGSSHILATLENVQVTDLSSVLNEPHLPPSVIQVNQSNETVTAEPGTNHFVIGSTSQTGDTISGFTLGQDSLVFGHHANTSGLTVQESGANTVVMNGSNTLVTLDGVQTTSLDALLHPSEAGGSSVSTGSTGTSTSTSTATSTTSTEGSGSSTGGTTDTGTTIELSQSNQTVSHSADSGSDTFVIDSLSQQNDVINGFTPGTDHIDFHDPSASGSALLSQLSFEATPDGSTDVVVGADTSASHVLLTLSDVLPTSLTAGTDYFAS